MQILKEDDSNWPLADRVGAQELEVISGAEHISFKTTKLGSLMQVNESKDPEGLRVFYYLVQVRSKLLHKNPKLNRILAALLGRIISKIYTNVQKSPSDLQGFFHSMLLIRKIARQMANNFGLGRLQHKWQIILDWEDCNINGKYI